MGNPRKTVIVSGASQGIGAGIVNAFVKVGMDVRFEAAPGEKLLDLQEMVDEGVRRAYQHEHNTLRASVQTESGSAPPPGW